MTKPRRFLEFTSAGKENSAHEDVERRISTLREMKKELKSGQNSRGIPTCLEAVGNLKAAQEKLARVKANSAVLQEEAKNKEQEFETVKERLSVLEILMFESISQENAKLEELKLARQKQERLAEAYQGFLSEDAKMVTALANRVIEKDLLLQHQAAERHSSSLGETGGYGHGYAAGESFKHSGSGKEEGGSPLRSGWGRIFTSSGPRRAPGVSESAPLRGN